MPFIRVSSMVASIALSVTASVTAQTPTVPPAAPSYETLFYAHDGLRLEAYFYQPDGRGPFPLVVYNHSSVPAGQESTEWQVAFLARVFVPAGYAFLVPERRGYGKSEGVAFSQAVGADRGQRFIARQAQEAGDVNAAVDDVLGRPGAAIDRHRIVIMGWSFGGIVTTLAASMGERYAGVVVQAPGALNWLKSDELQRALMAAAAGIKVPMLCAVAENDATTESARRLCARAAAAGSKTTVKVYPPYTESDRVTAPGHALFAPRGLPVWRDDLMRFLSDTLKPVR
jgi:dienelactone hydrolase